MADMSNYNFISTDYSGKYICAPVFNYGFTGKYDGQLNGKDAYKFDYSYHVGKY